MPYDLNAVQRGYGECEMSWQDQPITLRYNARIDHHTYAALEGVVIGRLGSDGKTRVPDFDGVFEQLVRLLLPSTPETPEGERGWSLVRGDEPVPITRDELFNLDLGMPQAMLMALFTDFNNPNRRRLSLSGSRVGASSQPTESPTTTPSSVTPNGQGSPPGPSPAGLTLVGSGAAGASGYGV